MKLRKSLILFGSAIAIYATVKRYLRKQKLEKQEPVTIPHINKYQGMHPDQIKEQFKQRIATGEWLTTEEYEDMMTVLTHAE